MTAEPKTYQFAPQLTQGEVDEARLDRYFAPWFTIRKATAWQQKIGIDRIYADRRDGRRWTVEYKADHVARRTGNAFVETVSVRRLLYVRPGWAYTSYADRLFYYVSGDDLVYIVRFHVLRAHLDRWIKSYPSRDIQNEGYITQGILVPLAEFEACAQSVVSM